MAWGYKPDNIAMKRYWGARAIFKPNDKYEKIEIPYDRKNFEGERDGSDDFINWINEIFFKWLKKNATAGLNYTRESISLTSLDGKYTGAATTNMSGGYLYIGCWEVN
jgi:hypothetical protein